MQQVSPLHIWNVHNRGRNRSQTLGIYLKKATVPSRYQAPKDDYVDTEVPVNLVYRPGKQLVIANTLSRSYIKDSTDSSTSFEFEVNTLTTVPISVDKLRLLQTQTHSDPALQCLMHATLH